ncbi:MAG: hypothetical protein GX369_08540 [Euryarchaeota archaeon]|nr:hypothetical protein [Euryarchaeota archaeon]
MDTTQAVTEGDIDVQRGLEQAVKAAAMMVTADSQASGKPRIHTSNALTAFKTTLAANLGLDKDTLTPLHGSAMKDAPSFTLMVYNGDNAFSASGARQAHKYAFSDGVLITDMSLPASGFPEKFGVTSNNIFTGGGGSISYTLDMPGCVAVINTSVKKIMGRTPLSPVRSATAKIVCPAGTCGI